MAAAPGQRTLQRLLSSAASASLDQLGSRFSEIMNETAVYSCQPLGSVPGSTEPASELLLKTPLLLLDAGGAFLYPVCGGQGVMDGV